MNLHKSLQCELNVMRMYEDSFKKAPDYVTGFNQSDTYHILNGKL